mgnify:FL=1
MKNTQFTVEDSVHIPVAVAEKIKVCVPVKEAH